jgi:hypothetical protein
MSASEVARHDRRRRWTAQPAAVRNAGDACGAVHDTAEVIVVTTLDSPCVKAAAHFERNPGSRRRIGERLLQLQCRPQCIARVIKHGMRTVADHLDNDAAMRFHCCAHERVVPRECGRHPLGMLLPQLRAALDVGKKNDQRFVGVAHVEIGARSACGRR